MLYRGRWLLALVALAGCRQVFGLPDPIPIDAPSGSGVRDGRHDGFDTLCVAAASWTVCVPAPSGPISLPAQIDTDTSQLCATARGACFVVGTTITGGQVTASGRAPLVLVATDQISLAALAGGDVYLAADRIAVTSSPIEAHVMSASIVR